MKQFDFPMRLARFLALAGVASRRKSETLISTGDISVNGNRSLEPGYKVTVDDVVKYKGRHLKLLLRCYIMLNKPVGYLCSASDPHAEKIIFDLIDLPGKRLFSVGRLDLNSEGLLILTDDGDYAEKLTHPRYGILKKYLVKTEVPLSRKDIELMQRGIKDDNEFLKTEKIVRKSGNEYIFTLAEGKKREIRRLIGAVSNQVRMLKRISIGNLKLGSLPVGKWRFLTKDEIVATMK